MRSAGVARSSAELKISRSRSDCRSIVECKGSLPLLDEFSRRFVPGESTTALDDTQLKHAKVERKTEFPRNYQPTNEISTPEERSLSTLLSRWEWKGRRRKRR